ncbi:MAG: HAMP domain-containing protein [Chitinivibrionales bacterium]|nr:HAMP domain-containing protein [Chitinivibrionales bacterium]
MNGALRGIKAKLIVYTCSVLLLFGMSVLIYSMYNSKNRIIAINKENSLLMIQGLSRQIAENIVYFDYESLGHNIKNIKLTPDIRDVFVIGLDTLILHDGTSQNSSQGQKFSNPLIARIIAAPQWTITINNNEMTIAGPAHREDSSLVGFVLATFSLQSVNKITSERIRTDSTMITLWLCIGIFMTIFFSELFIRPIMKISEATKRIGKGDLHTTIAVRGNDEIAALASSINTMTANLLCITTSRDELNREIEEHKKAKEQIATLNEELEQRVTSRTAELLQVNKRLESSMEILQRTQNKLIESEKFAALGNLVAGIAHEVNTPVGIGVTAASHLADATSKVQSLFSSGTMKKSDFEKYLSTTSEISTTLTTNMQRAATIIRNFKQVAVDQSSEAQRDFNLKEYIDSILVSLHPHFKKTKHVIHVECPESIIIMSYPGAFSQIFTNLILNSLNHSFAGIEQGQITLHIEQDTDMLILQYYDNGVGMTQEQTKRIFEPFYSMNRNKAGYGLGMHIVYNMITQQLMGSIECCSNIGKGTVFLMHLPFSDSLRLVR